MNRVAPVFRTKTPSDARISPNSSGLRKLPMKPMRRWRPIGQTANAYACAKMLPGVRKYSGCLDILEVPWHLLLLRLRPPKLRLLRV